ncbi:MAG: hypothetical protein UHX00_05355 [Caryophanon sp.]|nr:hypothetical protein [Caryophanon sp.]
MLLGTRGGLQREKHELETTGSSHARGKPASAWKANISYGEKPICFTIQKKGDVKMDFIMILGFLVLLIIVGKLLSAVGRFILSAIFTIALLIGLLTLAGIF